MSTAWTGPPPPSSGMRIYRPQTNSQTWVRFLGGLEWANLHWIDGKGWPCLGKDCRYCPAPAKPRGYAPVSLWQKKRNPDGTDASGWATAVLEITESNRWLSERELRGEIYEVTRSKGAYSVAAYRLVEKPVKDPLPDWFDVRPVLERVWRIDRTVQQPSKDVGEEPKVIPFRRIG